MQTPEDAQKFRLYNWNSAEDPDGNREVGPNRLLAASVQTVFRPLLPAAPCHQLVVIPANGTDSLMHIWARDTK